MATGERRTGERVGGRARQHRRLLWGSAYALAVLVLVGFSVHAPVKDWWLAREACGGRLPEGEVQTVRTKARLGAEEESFDKESGRYHCVLTNDEGKTVVSVDAYPERADRDQEMSHIGTSYPPYAVLPGGLPGFEAENSVVHLMPECPRHAAKPPGGHHRLLVSTWTYFAESREEKAAMLRLAVRMTNEMTEKLDCGGKRLSPPQDGAVPDTGRYVPRAQAKGTACDALATGRVPAEGREGKVRIAVAEGGMVGRCTLHAPKNTDDVEHRGLPPRPLVELTSWRGDWGGNIREMGSGPQPLPMSDSADWRPALTEDRAWAVAECGGENTGFAAHWGYDRPYRDEGEKSGTPEDREPEKERAALRAYVASFAKDQVRRGGCTKLQLP